MLGYRYMMLYYKVMRSIRARMDVGPTQLRAYLEKLAILNPPPIGTKVSEHKIGDIRVEEISLGETAETGIVFFIHGGAFAFGSSRTHRNMLAHISKLTGRRIYSVDYSLAPENRFPIALNECYTVYRWLTENHDTADIVIAGDSAGGNLSASLVHKLNQEGDRIPGGLCLLSPWLDLSKDSRSSTINNKKDSVFDKQDLHTYAAMYADETELKSPLVSPLRGDVSNFPPTLIQVAKNELLFHDSDEFREKLEAAKIQLKFEAGDRLFHSWHLFPMYLKEARKSLKSLSVFIKSTGSDKSIS